MYYRYKTIIRYLIQSIYFDPVYQHIYYININIYINHFLSNLNQIS